MGQTLTGFTEETSKNLILDAGCVFVNYDLKTDTLATSKKKLIGATSGGSEFNAIPEIRSIKIDGVKGKARGNQVLESWEVKMKINLIEFKEETFKYALGASKMSEETIETSKKYKKIEGKNFLEDKDYIDNITFMGRLSGSSDPIIIQVFNCLNMEGLKLNTKDGDDIVMELEFEGTYDAKNLDQPPFAIFYPEKVVTP